MTCLDFLRLKPFSVGKIYVVSGQQPMAQTNRVSGSCKVFFCPYVYIGRFARVYDTQYNISVVSESENYSAV